MFKSLRKDDSFPTLSHPKNHHTWAEPPHIKKQYTGYLTISPICHLRHCPCCYYNKEFSPKLLIWFSHALGLCSKNHLIWHHKMPYSNAISYTSYFLALIYLLLTTLLPGDIINLFMAQFTTGPFNPHIVNYEGRVLQFLFMRLCSPMSNIVPSGQ